MAFDERFLGEVVGIFVIGRHVVNGRINPLLIPANQLVVSSHVALLSPFHQDDILSGNRCGRRRGRVNRWHWLVLKSKSLAASFCLLRGPCPATCRRYLPTRINPDNHHKPGKRCQAPVHTGATPPAVPERHQSRKRPNHKTEQRALQSSWITL